MNYTYTIFDANPNESSGTAWDTHQDVAFVADSDDDARDDVRSVLETEACGLNPEDGYEAGQRLYALVWDEDDILIAQVSYELTEEDLA